LRAKAHHLQPVVTVGQHGLTPAVLHEVDLALLKHELIKVRVFSDERGQREAMLAQVCADMDCAPVQHVGKVLVLWRPNPELEKPAPRPARPATKPGAKRPKATRAGPRTPRHAVGQRARRQGNPRGGAFCRTRRRFQAPGPPHARNAGRTRSIWRRHGDVAAEDPCARCRGTGVRGGGRSARRGASDQAQVLVHPEDQAKVVRRQAQSPRGLGPEAACGQRKTGKRHASPPAKSIAPG
jgi:RNA-binding protein